VQHGAGEEGSKLEHRRRRVDGGQRHERAQRLQQRKQRHDRE
jgi:hypothetical protein